MKNSNFLIDKVEEQLGERYPLATIVELMKATVNATPTVSEKEVHDIIDAFKVAYPDWYGHTDDPNADIPTFLFFRNREESFDNEYAVVTIRFRRDG